MRNDLDLTEGSIGRKLILFAVPMIAGDLLQQMYNITDTLIVGKAIGSQALAAFGSAYALMTFLTSVFIGLSMGSGVLFSICFGKKRPPRAEDRRLACLSPDSGDNARAERRRLPFS